MKMEQRLISLFPHKHKMNSLSGLICNVCHSFTQWSSKTVLSFYRFHEHLSVLFYTLSERILWRCNCIMKISVTVRWIVSDGWNESSSHWGINIWGVVVRPSKKTREIWIQVPTFPLSSVTFCQSLSLTYVKKFHGGWQVGQEQNTKMLWSESLWLHTTEPLWFPYYWSWSIQVPVL